MADRSHDPRTDDDTDRNPEPAAITGAPRWVKVSGAIALVVLLLFVAAMLFGGGAGHGPGRHSGGGDDPPASAEVEPDGNGGHAPPEGGHG